MIRTLGTLLIVVLGFGLGTALAGETPALPAPPTKAPECPVWSGEIVGNATAAVTLTLCATTGDGVSGTLTFSSPDAGESTHAVVGEWAEDNLVLRDTDLLVDAPNPGWRFCLIDSYRLRRTETGALLGEYDSKACSDHAKIALSPVP